MLRPLFVSLLCLPMLGCVVVPKAKPPSFEERVRCNISTPQWQLEQYRYDIDWCNSGVSDYDGICVGVSALVVPATTLVVSGTWTLLGNAVHWLEEQMRCS